MRPATPPASAASPSAVPAAFSLGPREFTLDDVLAAAVCLGEWEQFRAAWLARQAAAQAAEAAGLVPEEAAIEEALEGFRYARDLVAGDECEAWLAARGLVFADLVDSVTRRLQAGLVEEMEDLERHSIAEGRLRIDALLSDEFGGWARRFARGLAAAVELGEELRPEDPVPGLWPALARAQARVTAAVLTPEARQRELAAQRLGLMRLHLDVAEFDSEPAAREALLCVREDGVTLAAVGEGNGLPCQTMERFLGELSPEWLTALQSARTGDVVLQRPDDGNWVVVAVKGRREPSLEDSAVVARVDAALTERSFRELESRHIRWRINVEVET